MGADKDTTLLYCTVHVLQGLGYPILDGSSNTTVCRGEDMREGRIKIREGRRDRGQGDTQRWPEKNVPTWVTKISLFIVR